MRFVTCAYVGVAAALAAASPAQAACEYGRVAELPVTMRGLRPTIVTKINGQDAVFIVDTGAFFSMISEDAAKTFGMKPSMGPAGLRIRGIGGSEAAAQVARAQEFVFAGRPYKSVEFLVGGRLGDNGTVGLLGQNILGAMDVEYDLANGYLRFFQAKGCDKANLAYWSAGKAVSRLPLKGGEGPVLTKVTTPAKIDGRQINVHWDSGASLSVLSRPAAARAGITANSDSVVAGGISYGIFGRGLETSLAPFGTFEIGDETITNTRLRVADIELQGGDMLLGADFFLSHRILVSRSQNKIYFTYNGGPVFRLDREARQVQAAVAPEESGSLKDPGPKTAGEFSLRGSASLARRDIAAAIADFSKAIALEPGEPRFYKERAMARLATGQPLPAMSDLAEVLKRKPGDVDALIARGALHLSVKEDAKARADFDAARRQAPNDHQIVLRIAGVYSAHDAFEPALQEYDRWLAARPNDPEVAGVLNERCWLRARLGKQLEAALADCDLALKRGGKNSAFMDSRGLVLLRLGRFGEAIRQYDAAIKAQPKHAWSLYGRGLAKLRAGDKAGGDADIAAALAIDRGVADEARRMGLTTDDPRVNAG